MSEITKQNYLTKVPEQPPLSWYFDPKLLEIEQRVLFGQGPNYVGHELMTPNLGDYHVLDGSAQMLVRNQHGVEQIGRASCRERV